MLRLHILIIGLLTTFGCHHEYSHHHRGKHQPLIEVSGWPKQGTYYHVTENSKGEKEMNKINLKNDLND